ncbi:hypothetical protein GE09DRAFT_1219265 [Coniochaeta sp. 2T2.1]|nr:hypothetical protein GE09DRAFT_1219265 [Coniochaeta sp. 2T2.1]
MESYDERSALLEVPTYVPGGILPRLTGSSTVSTACNYTTESFFSNATTECKPYIEALETCPTSSVPIKVRLEAASNAARCLEIYWKHAWYGDNYVTTPSSEDLTGSHSPPQIEKDVNCSYPDFFPILDRTCSFDLRAFDNTCSNTYNGPGDVKDAYLKCQSAAAEQYVRCTLQKNASEVASCVADNAVKVDWLHQIQSYAGASSCPDANQILAVLGLGLLLQLLQTLFRVLGYHRTRQAVSQRTRSFRKNRSDVQEQQPQPAYIPPEQQQTAYELQQSESTDYPQKPPVYAQYMVYQQDHHPSHPYYHANQPTHPAAAAFPPDTQRSAAGGGYHYLQPHESPLSNPWPRPFTLEKIYTLKATRLLQSVGREVLVAYLTVLILSQYDLATSSTFLEELSFYLVRPRNAPFFGLLGIFEPWSQQGLAELTVDGVLSFFAGSYVASKYWKLAREAPANPAAPYRPQLKTLAAGSVMTFVPDFVLFIGAFLVALGIAAVHLDDGQGDGGRRKRKKEDDDGACCAMCCGAACIWSAWMAVLAAFIAILPLVGVIEIIATVVMTIRHKRRVKKGRIDGAWEMWERKRSSWEAPLTTERRGFRTFYYFLVLGSFIINIGNWIFFASYLKLEGEMYCPPRIGSVLAMWVLVPLGIDMIFFAYRVWTQDIGYSGSGAPGLADGPVIP